MFERDIRPLLKDTFSSPLNDQLIIRVQRDMVDRVEDGIVVCPQLHLERIQVIAQRLAKSIALMRYEDAGDAAFDEVEPLASELEKHRRTPRNATKLAKRIGTALSALTRTIGRLEVAEKPEVLWEHPELDPFHARLQDELELLERQSALERKPAVTEKATRAVLDLRLHQQSLRVEWYIVILILVDILISLHELAG